VQQNLSYAGVQRGVSDMHRELAPDEVALRGAWASRGGAVCEDEVAARIGWLVRTHLERIGAAATGWDTLYRDPRDGRYWEMVYPESERHGGGPPSLHVISREAASAKYGAPAS
jgi:hypothetical protein